MRIVFATGNANKVREIKAILADLNMEVLSMKEAGVLAEAEENGTTFAENAVIKAKDIAAKVPDAIVMADDSGLVVDALNGEPGIYSARYMGEDTPYSVKNANIIKRLEGVPVEERTARFVCAIAAVLPDGRVFSTEGTIEGYIGYEERGNGGFGYDPIFMVPEYGCSTAELSAEAKNAISHRGRALNAMKVKLLEALGN
jgi:XTP/dITP diphosphohydrolase